MTDNWREARESVGRFKEGWNELPSGHRGSVIWMGIGVTMILTGLGIMWGTGAVLVGLGSIIVAFGLGVWM